MPDPEFTLTGPLKDLRRLAFAVAALLGIAISCAVVVALGIGYAHGQRDALRGHIHVTQEAPTDAE